MGFSGYGEKAAGFSGVFCQQKQEEGSAYCGGNDADGQLSGCDDGAGECIGEDEEDATCNGA